MHPFSALLVAIVVAFTAVCAVIDWRTWRIPNWLTVPAFILGLAARTAHEGWAGLFDSLLGFGIGFGLLLVLWLLGGGGAGDVKMMGALGAWLGMDLILRVFLASALATIVLALGALAYRRIASRASGKRQGGKDRGPGKAKGSGRLSNEERRIGRLMPYSMPVAVGTWVVLYYAWSIGTLP